MSSRVRRKELNAVSRISGVVLVNAMVFQEILSLHLPDVLPLSKVLEEEYPTEKYIEHWQLILGINYYPIFHLARQILLDLTANPDITKAVRDLTQTAQRIVGNRAALRHDLMGRVYHRLLADKKYLATYFTSVPAAVLLLRLALNRSAWSTEWHDLDQLREFRVADLACGTGTLLMAAADTIGDNYVAACAERGQRVDLARLHAALTEEILFGYDVLPSAVHLTASTLALKSPEVVFKGMNLFSLPFGSGGVRPRLGSIDFLGSGQLGVDLALFGSPSTVQQVGPNAAPDGSVATLPKLDLCVMNPPFTRSVGGNLLFGSAPPKERAAMQKELKRVVKQAKASASITAGLGSVFVAIADRYIKCEGRIALVLPKALLSGVAWDRTRELLRNNYRVECIVSSHDPERWNFSESTDLSEVLVVAQKVGSSNSQEDPSRSVTALNLWNNPTTSFDALAVASGLLRNGAPDIAEGQGALDVELGNTKMGEALSIPWATLKDQYLWLLPCAFAQSDLIRVAYYLTRNRLWIPGQKARVPIPLSPLGELATLGPDARDVHDGFKVVQATTPYPAFWGHDTTEVQTVAQRPNRHLSPLSAPKPNRSLRKVVDLWPLAGNVLVAERLRVNTQRLAAIRVSKGVLSSVWWSLSLRQKRSSEKNGKVLALWLNSTLALILLLAHREETEGAWMKFKKPVLAGLPTLDLTLLSRHHRDGLASAYDRLCGKTIQPFPSMAVDPVREEIDDAIATALDLPDLSVLRSLVAQEPVVCLKRL